MVGDLQADDIFCPDDGIRIFDYLEFSDRMRYCDKTADVVFIAIDLERLGRPDVASKFLDHENAAGQAVELPVLALEALPTQ
jgi:uncharacterized protein